MHIVLVHSREYREHVQQLGEELVFRGHEVKVVYPVVSSDELLVEKVTHVGLCSSSDLEFANRLHLWLLRETPHVIEAYSGNAALLIEQLIGSTPTVVRYEEPLDGNPVSKGPLREAWSQHLLSLETVRRADLAISSSVSSVEAARSLGVESAHIPLGVDENEKVEDMETSFVARMTWDQVMPLYEEAYARAILSAMAKGRVRRW